MEKSAIYGDSTPSDFCNYLQMNDDRGLKDILKDIKRLLKDMTKEILKRIKRCHKGAKTEFLLWLDMVGDIPQLSKTVM